MGRKSRAAVVVLVAFLHVPFVHAAPVPLASAVVQSAGATESVGFDGVVEAVRQTVIAPQVSGVLIELDVKAGDTVKAGQVIARIDARAAAQNTAASRAQVQAARSALEVAEKNYERQRQLFQKKYISQSALERAEAEYRAASAQLKAQIAQASATNIQSNFYVVKTPYAGVVAEVPVTLGDMAMPGRPLLTLYDPAALRVTVAIPQTALAQLAPGQPTIVELPGLPPENRRLTRTQIQVLPTVDAATHSTLVRIELPKDLKNVTPGMFARVWLPMREGPTGRLFVPVSALVQRAELTGVYVIDANGRPILRQVRAGRVQGDKVEILAGLAAGERVALDPQAAAAYVQ